MPTDNELLEQIAGSNQAILEMLWALEGSVTGANLAAMSVDERLGRMEAQWMPVDYPMSVTFCLHAIFVALAWRHGLEMWRWITNVLAKKSLISVALVVAASSSAMAQTPVDWATFTYISGPGNVGRYNSQTGYTGPTIPVGGQVRLRHSGQNTEQNMSLALYWDNGAGDGEYTWHFGRCPCTNGPGCTDGFFEHWHLNESSDNSGVPQHGDVGQHGEMYFPCCEGAGDEDQDCIADEDDCDDDDDGQQDVDEDEDDDGIPNDEDDDDDGDGLKDNDPGEDDDEDGEPNCCDGDDDNDGDADHLDCDWYGEGGGCCDDEEDDDEDDDGTEDDIDHDDDGDGLPDWGEDDDGDGTPNGEDDDDDGDGVPDGHEDGDGDDNEPPPDADDDGIPDEEDEDDDDDGQDDDEDDDDDGDGDEDCEALIVCPAVEPPEVAPDWYPPGEPHPDCRCCTSVSESTDNDGDDESTVESEECYGECIALGYPQCPGEEDEEDGSGCDCCDDLLAALGRIEDKLDPGEYENPEGQADARGYAEENVRSEFNSFKGEVDDKELLPEFDLALPDVGQHGSYYVSFRVPFGGFGTGIDRSPWILGVHTLPLNNLLLYPHMAGVLQIVDTIRLWVRLLLQLLLCYRYYHYFADFIRGLFL